MLTSHYPVVEIHFVDQQGAVVLNELAVALLEEAPHFAQVEQSRLEAMGVLNDLQISSNSNSN